MCVCVFFLLLFLYFNNLIDLILISIIMLLTILTESFIHLQNQKKKNYLNTIDLRHKLD